MHIEIFRTEPAVCPGEPTNLSYFVFEARVPPGHYVQGLASYDEETKHHMIYQFFRPVAWSEAEVEANQYANHTVKHTRLELTEQLTISLEKMLRENPVCRKKVKLHIV